MTECVNKSFIDKKTSNVILELLLEIVRKLLELFELSHAHCVSKLIRNGPCSIIKKQPGKG